MVGRCTLHYTTLKDIFSCCTVSWSIEHSTAVSDDECKPLDPRGVPRRQRFAPCIQSNCMICIIVSL